MKLHPSPTASNSNWRTETTAVAAIHHIVLADALAVTAWSVCKLTTDVLQKLKILVTANLVTNTERTWLRYLRYNSCSVFESPSIS